MNNKYKIRVGHPLLRPGLTIETESSEKYLVDVVTKLLEKVREINKPSEDPMDYFSKLAEEEENDVPVKPKKAKMR